MATPGVTVSLNSVIPLPRQETAQRLVASLSGQVGGYFDGFEVTSDGHSMIHVTRRFVPTWAIVVAIIGAVCALLGLLALLYRDTETCAIQLRDVPEGTMVTATGVLGSNVHSILTWNINSLQAR